MKSLQDGKENKPFKIQTLPITMAGLIASAVHGIIGYVAVYFFKPAWEKFIAFLKKENK